MMADPWFTDEVADARAFLLEGFRPDTFAVIRTASTSDGAGGHTTATATVASGACLLRVVGGGTEQIIADRAGFQQAYAVDLDPSVDVRPSDTITVNGRVMEIGGVARGGVWSIEQTLIVQEVG